MGAVGFTAPASVAQCWQSDHLFEQKRVHLVLCLLALNKSDTALEAECQRQAQAVVGDQGSLARTVGSERASEDAPRQRYVVDSMMRSHEAVKKVREPHAWWKDHVLVRVYLEDPFSLQMLVLCRRAARSSQELFCQRTEQCCPGDAPALEVALDKGDGPCVDVWLQRRAPAIDASIRAAIIVHNVQVRGPQQQVVWHPLSQEGLCFLYHCENAQSLRGTRRRACANFL